MHFPAITLGLYPVGEESGTGEVLVEYIKNGARLMMIINIYTIYMYIMLM